MLRDDWLERSLSVVYLTFQAIGSEVNMHFPLDRSQNAVSGDLNEHICCNVTINVLFGQLS